MQRKHFAGTVFFQRAPLHNSEDEMRNDPIFFPVGEKEITVYPAENREAPAVYLNVFEGNGSGVFEQLKDIGVNDHTLIVIGKLDWNAEMTPWEMPPLYKNDAPCSGKADEYLSFLSNRIIPEAEKKADIKPLYRALAGYSLAGLFALYTLYRSTLFSRAAVVSGSLWYKDFSDFAKTKKMVSTPDKLFFSLGDKECKTKNQILKTVQERTEELYRFYKNNGINTESCLNEGNHFAQPDRRTACGIKWILN